MTRTRILALAAVFVCGIALGGIGGAAAMRQRMLAMLHQGGPDAAAVSARLRAVLALTPEQSEKVDAIVRTRHAAIESARRESTQTQRAEFTALRAEVAEILAPEQRDRWFHWCERIARAFLPRD